jgi:hypothetical protein
MKIEIKNISGSNVSVTGGSSLDIQKKVGTGVGVITGNNIKIDGQEIHPGQSLLSNKSAYPEGLNINGDQYEMTGEIDPTTGNFLYKKIETNDSSTTSPVKG